MSAADRDAYRVYVAQRLAAFLEHTGGTGRVWDRGALVRAGRGTRNDDDAFRGPWRNVRPYVTTEFRQWVDEYDAERLTFAQWQRAAVDARAAKAAEERDYFESVEFFTDELRRWAELTRERDALIVAARERGATFRDLEAASGLSRMTIHNVIAADRRAMAQHEEVAA